VFSNWANGQNRDTKKRDGLQKCRFCEYQIGNKGEIDDTVALSPC
jgi:hypothetical protein